MRPPMPFPGAVTEIHGRLLPEPAIPAGYAALIAAYSLSAEVPRTLTAIGARHKIFEKDGWLLLTPRHRPAATLEGHLTFALKYEGVDLAVLKALFSVITPAILVAMIRSKPTGRYMRRVWFLAEWLTGKQLDLLALRRGSYVNALDQDVQYAGRSVNSPRHRVRNNLPGTPAFCPLVFRTAALEDAAKVDYGLQMRLYLADVPEEHRPFVWLAFANGEASSRGGPDTPRAILRQWKRGTMGCPAAALTIDEACLMKRLTSTELLARYPDFEYILAGVAAFAANTTSRFPVPLTAACLAFGFARATGETDPYERTHRYLAQKYFAHTGYRAEENMVSVSIVAHHKMAEYRRLLASSAHGGLFDATPHAEFYYRCLKTTFEIVFPKARRFAAEKYEAELSNATSGQPQPANTTPPTR